MDCLSILYGRLIQWWGASSDMPNIVATLMSFVMALDAH